jgi:hypothetical protein
MDFLDLEKNMRGLNKIGLHLKQKGKGSYCCGCEHDLWGPWGVSCSPFDSR